MTGAVQKPAAGPGSTSLTGYHWRLATATDAQGKRIDALFARADKPVQLDFAGDRLSVVNACNRMGGSYMVEGSRLTVSRLASTRMACREPVLAALDDAIGQRITGMLTIALQAGDTPRLTLTSASGDVLAFDGAPTAETRFGGPGERMFLEVAAQTRSCSHPLIPNMQCLQVREIRYDDRGLKVGEPGEWQNFYEQIEGYTHEPGVRNVLRVMRYKRTAAPADASTLAYVLDTVVESESIR